jgi:hypothetical protein
LLLSCLVHGELTGSSGYRVALQGVLAVFLLHTLVSSSFLLSGTLQRVRWRMSGIPVLEDPMTHARAARTSAQIRLPLTGEPLSQAVSLCRRLMLLMLKVAIFNTDLSRRLSGRAIL